MARMERLVYWSTATGRTDSLLNMATILAESDRNNARDGLTGALAAHDDRFFQVIEGPSAALDSLLRRLESDPRHRDVVMLDRMPASGRLFGDWTMANARITPALAGPLDSLTGRLDVSPAQVTRLLLEAVGQRC